MRYKGRITKWKDGQGFGFITPDGGGQPVFLHITSISNRQRRPVENESVTYELKTDAKGRSQANSVVFVDDRVPSVITPRRSNVSFILVFVFLIVVAVSVFAHKLPFGVLGLYLLVSVVAFIAYALDKLAAENDKWRIPENTLHLLALAGGWPGALVAQRLLRHKSKKQSFQIVFWTTVALNCGGFGWLFLYPGAEALRVILGGP